MTLKEKSEEAWNNYEYKKGNLYSNCFKDGFEQGAKIADDFAIGFAEWTSYKYKYLENKGWFRSSYELEMGIFKSSKKLLEIYKDEKGL